MASLGCLFLVNHYQYSSHIPSPSPITLSKSLKKKVSPPLLKTLRVCFKTAFKTCHCEGETKYTVLQTPCLILSDIVTNWHLFTDTLLICSCKEGASIFNQTWDECLGVCAPLVSVPKGLCCLLSWHLVHCSPSLYSRQFHSPLLTHPTCEAFVPLSPSSSIIWQFFLTATSCSPSLLAASVHACRKNVLPGAWIVLLKHVQHPV